MDSTDKYYDVKEHIAQIFHKNKGRYGYRRVTAELHNRGCCINHKTVQRLMRTLGLFCAVRMKKSQSFLCLAKKLYLSPMLDLYNEEIISYSISYHPTFSQINEMLSEAFGKIPDNTNLILHSDQGWQYQMKTYQNSLRSKGIRQSMSRKGNCLDNAVMENFFGLIKTELLYLQEFTSIDQFLQELYEYIDYYNNHRTKIKLKGMSPVGYRTHSLKIA